MFSQACVKNYVRGGGRVVYPSIHWAGRCLSQHALGRGVPAQGGVHPLGPEADNPPPRRPLQRMVRILLECILVLVMIL